ncbi:hypothetical protein TNCV_3444501 [Trichonephila clavipes]|nr:hypothetical protein TNCV_3444501 [Trichonephila clavipes]
MADCLSNGEAAFRVCVECEMRMITLSRVARRSFLIRCCVNVVTSVPVRVPSPCTGSEASSVRTGQWGSPIVKKTASDFATLRAIFHLENQSSKTRRCLLIALAMSLGSVSNVESDMIVQGPS